MLQNKYTTVYYAIVQKARQRGADKRVLDYYTERHHIVPRSLGGEDTPSNLVLLTAKEHFVCHHLLTKMTEGHSKLLMEHAFGFMCQVIDGKQTQRSGQYPNANRYTQRRINAATRSPEWRKKIGDANRGRKMTPEFVEANRLRLTGRKLSDSHRANIAKASAIRGVSQKARDERYKTLVKQWVVTYPDGSTEIVENIKQWCLSKGTYSSAYQTSYKSGKPAKSGILQGYRFSQVTDT